VSAPVPGWYVNPSGPGRRFWDGERWTDYTDDDADSLPASIPAPPGVLAGYVPPPREPREPGEGVGYLVIAGYYTAVVMPVIGFVIGIVCMRRRDEPRTRAHGAWIFILALIAVLIWVALLHQLDEELASSFS
jgi:hypothetical protein